MQPLLQGQWLLDGGMLSLSGQVGNLDSIFRVHLGGVWPTLLSQRRVPGTFDLLNNGPEVEPWCCNLDVPQIAGKCLFLERR